MKWCRMHDLVSAQNPKMKETAPGALGTLRFPHRQ
jgi:hypothetical protein